MKKFLMITITMMVACDDDAHETLSPYAEEIECIQCETTYEEVCCGDKCVWNTKWHEVPCINISDDGNYCVEPWGLSECVDSCPFLLPTRC